MTSQCPIVPDHDITMPHCAITLHNFLPYCPMSSQCWIMNSSSGRVQCDCAITIIHCVFTVFHCAIIMIYLISQSSFYCAVTVLNCVISMLHYVIMKPFGQQNSILWHHNDTLCYQNVPMFYHNAPLGHHNSALWHYNSELWHFSVWLYHHSVPECFILVPKYSIQYHNSIFWQHNAFISPQCSTVPLQ